MLAVAALWSVAFYSLSVVIVYTGCRIFGARPALISLAAAVPVMLLIFMILISLGGIGL